jgi:Metallo-peptidase family M12
MFLDGLLGPIAVYTQNFSKEGAPAGADWRTPGWAQFWIDGGSSAPDSTAVTLTPPHDGDITAHEMGHVFGMNHDVGADLNTDYQDPCCIMSQNGSFVHPTLLRNFGPAVCLPHLIQRDWMYKRRVYYDKGDWQSQSEGITLPLAPICRPIARANLGIRLAYTKNETNWDYYLEYVVPEEWDRGVPGAPLFFVRRMAPKYGGTPAYLGYLTVPAVVGATAEFVDPSGNVRFSIELTDLSGPILSVSAKKL